MSLKQDKLIITMDGTRKEEEISNQDEYLRHLESSFCIQLTDSEISELKDNLLK